MAFEKSLSEIVNSQRKALNELAQEFELAALRMFRSAANSATQLFSNLHRDPAFIASMRNIKTYAGLSGAAAGKEWVKQWSANVANLGKNFRSVNYYVGELEQRLKRLSERQTMMWSQAARAKRSEMEALTSIDQQLSLNDQARKKLISDKAQVTRAVNAGTMSAADANRERDAIDERINRIKDMNDELQVTRDSVAGLGERFRMLKAAERVQDIKDKAFGGIMKGAAKVSEGLDVARLILKNPAALASIFALAIVGILAVLWGEIKKGIRVFREAGQIPSQWATSLGSAIRVQRSMLRHGMFLDMEESAKIINALQSQSGRIDVGDRMANSVGYMHKMFAMSEESAASLMITMQRFLGYNERGAESLMNETAAWAKANKVNARYVLEDMSKYSDDIAKAGTISFTTFRKASVDARQIGYELSKMTGLADKLVSDFEGALKTQAELTTIFPGMDMSEVIYASAFGDIKQISDAVRNMLKESGVNGDNFNTMPRMQKMLLERNLGFSSSELLNMLNGKPIDERSAVDKQLEKSEAIRAGLFDVADQGIPGVIKVLKNILSVITLGTGNWLFGDNNKKDLYGNDGIKPGNMSNWGHVPRYHTGGFAGLKSNEVPAILQRGEAVLSKNTTEAVFTALGDPASQSSTQVNTSNVEMKHTIFDALNSLASPKPTKNNQDVVDMQRVESLLVELIRATREGKVIELDGQLVGKQIIKSNMRNNG